ncbi:MAG: TolC family protein [Deltaproteobacteria bacterium]|nr:TolC family protein [Deltaproteobacteria bacterium]
MLWEQSPEVIDARAAAATAASELGHARTLPNPQLDFTWGTIPIGTTNPRDLHDPVGNVPNYGVGISELIELGKRGPRTAAAAAQVAQARAQALATLSGRFFALLAAIGDLAKNQVRAAVLGGQVRAGEDVLRIERARAAKGATAGADVERSEVEQMRLRAARDAALSDLERARGACAAIVAAPCPKFPSYRQARQFLRAALRADLPRAWRAEFERRRPDVAALDAALRAADEQATLARRRTIPDVTVRADYTYDTFVASGNQRQSAALGIQVPLPLFDRGQADLQAAAAALTRARGARRAIVATAAETLAVAARRRDLAASRVEHMRAALAMARAVRRSMEGAAREGGVSQLEVLLARRAHQELLLDRADLDADAYDAALRIREAAALFPLPAAATTSPEGDASDG